MRRIAEVVAIVLGCAMAIVGVLYAMYALAWMVVMP